MKITAGFNAGLFVECANGLTIWIDAFHEPRVIGFSGVTPSRLELLLSMMQSAPPDLLFFTHNHPDHYSSSQTALALQRCPEVRVLAPHQIGSHAPVLDRDSVSYDYHGVKFSFFELPHELPYNVCTNYGVLIDDGCTRLLIPGDCAIGAPELAQRLSQTTQPDAVVLPFLWLTKAQGRRFMDAHFPNAEIILNHLPLPEDDRFRYRDLVDTCRPLCKPVTLFTEFLQCVTLPCGT